VTNLLRSTIHRIWWLSQPIRGAIPASTQSIGISGQSTEIGQVRYITHANDLGAVNAMFERKPIRPTIADLDPHYVVLLVVVRLPLLMSSLVCCWVC